MALALPDATALFGIGARTLTVGYLVTMMFSTGLELGGKPKEDKSAKRRQRRLLLRALAINLILLPLVTVTLTRALRVTGDATIALLLLAVTPGGRFAPQLTRLAGGELGLSVEITLFLAKLTAFTAPPTARLLLGGQRVELHELTLIAQLVVLQIAPYLAGKLLRQRQSGLAERLVRPLHVMSAVCIAALVALLLAHRQFRDLWLLGARDWLALLSVATVSLALGWLLGGPTAGTRRAFAVSTSSRNLALALLVAGVAFPERNVQLALLAQWLVFVALGVLFALWRRHGEAVGKPPMVGPKGLPQTTEAVTARSSASHRWWNWDWRAEP